jgi:hypothetical protein
MRRGGCCHGAGSDGKPGAAACWPPCLSGGPDHRCGVVSSGGPRDCSSSAGAGGFGAASSWSVTPDRLRRFRTWALHRAEGLICSKRIGDDEPFSTMTARWPPILMLSEAVQRYDGLVLNAVRPARLSSAAFAASYTPSCWRSARGTVGVTGGQHQTTRWPMTVIRGRHPLHLGPLSRSSASSAGPCIAGPRCHGWRGA